jgi:nitroimidazol reductase NimA-like FMN-containing flavoprotein (pyridoxamine 5'-phosphate oxidase superfamily)
MGAWTTGAGTTGVGTLGVFAEEVMSMRLLDYRTGLEVIELDDCLRLLAEHQFGTGRVGLVDGTHPAILPVTYALHGEHVVFRTAAGSKLEAALSGASVAFEIDHSDELTHRGWSVLVKGWAEVITSSLELARLQTIPLRPWADGARPAWVQIRPEVVTGRRVNAPS